MYRIHETLVLAGVVHVVKSSGFVDSVTVNVFGGRGGAGIISFRREKYVPQGGPDGGDGGNGGDVVIVARTSVVDLRVFRGGRVYRADAGGGGGNSRKHGPEGEDLRLDVPLGTDVATEDREIFAELLEDGDEVIVAKGGRGGLGNAQFATPTRQAPRVALRGEPGEERSVSLELRLIADVGIIGLPNAGKSTLLMAVTAAHPKIGDYPFTTLSPNLGVMEFEDHVIKMADIPGLIEGAHEGHGLGHEFLRHIQRTRVLLHVVDGSVGAPRKRIETIDEELRLFDPALADRPQVIAVNKMDTPAAIEFQSIFRSELAGLGRPLVEVSAWSGQGIDGLVEILDRCVTQAKANEPARPRRKVVLRPKPVDGVFEVRVSEGLFEVTGRAVERVAQQTEFDNPESIALFQRTLNRIGVTKALADAGARSGSTVNIAGIELEWQ